MCRSDMTRGSLVGAFSVAPISLFYACMNSAFVFDGTTVSMGRRSICWSILPKILSCCYQPASSEFQANSISLSQSKSSLLADLRQQQEEVSSLKLSHAEDAAALTVMQGQISQAHVRKTQSGVIKRAVVEERVLWSLALCISLAANSRPMTMLFCG